MLGGSVRDIIRKDRKIDTDNTETSTDDIETDAADRVEIVDTILEDNISNEKRAMLEREKEKDAMHLLHDNQENGEVFQKAHREQERRVLSPLLNSSIKLFRFASKTPWSSANENHPGDTSGVDEIANPLHK